MMQRYKCPCCGFLTLSEAPPGTFEICPVCFWEDDNIQFENPDYEGGANEESLQKSQKNFREIGASSKKYLKHVRKPNLDEIPRRNFSKNIFFYSKKEEIDTENYDIVIFINKYVNNKNELFDAFSSKLNFPPYFGKNWDAFYDCLCSLDYLNEKKILIFHEDLPLKDSEMDRNNYLDILVDLESISLKECPYTIKAAFPMQYKDLINQR